VTAHRTVCHPVAGRAAAQWHASEGGRQIVRLWAHPAHRNMQARATMAPSYILDVRFTDLLSDLPGTMQRILTYAGLPIPDDLDAQATRFKNRKGPKHIYALEDYSLTEDQIADAFAKYRATFLA